MVFSTEAWLIKWEKNTVSASIPSGFTLWTSPLLRRLLLLLTDFSITYVNSNGNQVMACYASVYIFIWRSFWVLWFPAASGEINNLSRPSSTMAAQGFTVYFIFFFCEWQCRILCEYLIRITSHGKCLQSLKISQQLRERTCWRVSGRVACGCRESPWRVCPRDKAGPLQPSLQANCD